VLAPHAAHADETPDPVEKVPAVHAVQTDDPAIDEYRPGGHLEQLAAAMAPAADENRPASHATQAPAVDWPRPEEY